MADTDTPTADDLIGLGLSADELEALTSETLDALGVWFDAMLDQRTVWARARNGIGEISEDWFEAVVVELRRPSPYNVAWGTVCVRRKVGRAGCTYIFRPVSDCLSLTDPRVDETGTTTS